MKEYRARPPCCFPVTPHMYLLVSSTLAQSIVWYNASMAYYPTVIYSEEEHSSWQGLSTGAARTFHSPLLAHPRLWYNSSMPYYCQCSSSYIECAISFASVAHEADVVRFIVVWPFHPFKGTIL